MFLRGQIGPVPKWLAEMDWSKEIAAIEEKWIKTGKMLSYNMWGRGLRMIGPEILGMTEEQRPHFMFYVFRDVECFKEWALGAPEHMAMHAKLMIAMQDAAKKGLPPGPSPGQPGYHFHATDDPNVDIPALRAELKGVYTEIENSDWAHVPPGAIVRMMMGNHD